MSSQWKQHLNQLPSDNLLNKSSTQQIHISGICFKNVILKLLLPYKVIAMESECKKRNKSFPKMLFMRLENKNIFLPLVYVAKKVLLFSKCIYKIRRIWYPPWNDTFMTLSIQSLSIPDVWLVLKYIHCLEVSECMKHDEKSKFRPYDIICGCEIHFWVVLHWETRDEKWAMHGQISEKSLW